MSSILPRPGPRGTDGHQRSNLSTEASTPARPSQARTS
jgi:hypothetical protein